MLLEAGMNIYGTSGHGAMMQKHTIDRTTATQAVVVVNKGESYEYELRFDRTVPDTHGFYERGTRAGYSRVYWRIETPELATAYKREHLCMKFRRIDLDKLGISQLIEILDIAQRQREAT